MMTISAKRSNEIFPFMCYTLFCNLRNAPRNKCGYTLSKTTGDGRMKADDEVTGLICWCTGRGGKGLDSKPDMNYLCQQGMVDKLPS